jgi:hypothetical protein
MAASFEPHEPPQNWHPRSGFDEAGGYMWLPRLLDKLRRAEAQPDVPYLILAASPLDAFFLADHRLKGDQLRGWVREGLSDEQIAERIAAHAGEDAAARARWNLGFKLKYFLFLKALDADEGRLGAGPGVAALKAVADASFLIASRLNGLRGR